MQVRVDVETDHDFNELFKVSGCRTQGELLKKIIQLGFIDQIKSRQLRDIGIEAEEVTTNAVTKLQHHLEAVAKIYVDYMNDSDEQLFQLANRHEERTATIEKERLALSRQTHDLTDELAAATRKVSALEGAAKTNAEVIASYENYKAVTKPKVEQLEQQLAIVVQDRKAELEQLERQHAIFEQTKKTEIELLNQKVRQLEVSLQAEQQRVIEREHATKELELDYEKKLLEERSRSSEEQRKISLDMQTQLHSERERSSEAMRKLNLEMQAQLDSLREQLYQARIDKQPAKVGRPPKEKEA